MSATASGPAVAETTAIAAKIDQLEARLVAQPNDFNAVNQLVTLLSRSPAAAVGAGPYALAQRRLAERFARADLFAAFDDLDAAASRIEAWRAILAEAGVVNRFPSIEIRAGAPHRIDGELARCGRRMALFNAEGVIPAFCMRCYKVQVLVADVASLFRLWSTIYRLSPPRDNARKCMVELREEIAFPYKAYIYCEAEGEAHALRRDVEAAALAAGLDARAVVAVSHGCSEYGHKYRDFKYREDGGHRRFERPQVWDEIEAEFFEKRPIDAAAAVDPEPETLTLRDVFTLETWLAYAEILGDETARPLQRGGPVRFPERFDVRVAMQAPPRIEQLAELRARLAADAEIGASAA